MCHSERLNTQVFGSNDFWTGMGLFFDSFDNDGQKNNPFVALMINDGTRQYDHQTDGSQQMLSGCLFLRISRCLYFLKLLYFITLFLLFAVFISSPFQLSQTPFHNIPFEKVSYGKHEEYRFQ